VQLAQVADLLVRDPLLKPTAAMKRVMRTREDWGATDATLIRRWQAKFKVSRDALLAAARDRAPPRPTHDFRSWMKVLGDLRSCPELENFGEQMKALRDLPELRKFGEQMKALTDMPALRQLNEQIKALADMPYLRKLDQHMKDVQNSPALRALRDVQTAPALWKGLVDLKLPPA
jgi:hypothetical protein